MTLRRSLLRLAATALVVALGAAHAPALAHPTTAGQPADEQQDDGEGVDGTFDDLHWRDNGVLDARAEVGEGRCTPAVVGQDELTTCRFPLTGSDRELPPFPLHATEGVAVGGVFGVSSRCVVADDDLVCADLAPSFGDAGEREVFLPLFADQRGDEPAATFRVDRVTDGVVGLALASNAVAWSGVPTRIPAFRSFRLADAVAVDLLLRRDGEDDVVARVPALGPGVVDAEAEVTFPAPGRWTVTGCAVGGDGDCTAEGHRRPFTAVDPTPLPLPGAPSHVPGADVVHLVLYGSGWGDDETGFLTAARSLLSLDGGPVVERFRFGAEGEAGDLGVEDVVGVGWGPFAVEPFLGNEARFAFWYLPGHVPGGGLNVQRAVFGEDAGEVLGPDPAALGLDGPVVMANVSLDGQRDGMRANATEPLFPDDGELPDGELAVGSFYLPLSDDTPGFEATTLTHELGHALLDLRDEYVEPGLTEPTTGYPNCTDDPAEAAAWWGDLVGEVDPMVARWQATEEALGRWFRAPGEAEDLVRVGFVEGPGCYAEASALRPTRDSLMHNEIPVLGAVNRRWAERVLARFSGRATYDPAVHDQAMSLGCELAPVDDPDLAAARDAAGDVDAAVLALLDDVASTQELACTGRLAPRLDLAGPVTLTVTTDVPATPTGALPTTLPTTGAQVDDGNDTGGNDTGGDGDAAGSGEASGRGGAVSVPRQPAPGALEDGSVEVACTAAAAAEVAADLPGAGVYVDELEPVDPRPTALACTPVAVGRGAVVTAVLATGGVGVAEAAGIATTAMPSLPLAAQATGAAPWAVVIVAGLALAAVSVLFVRRRTAPSRSDA